MLKTLPLHILRELGKSLGLALLVFSFVMLAVSSVQLVRDGASFITILLLIPHMFPVISPMVLPLTIIAGTLVCYGRIAGNNEYVAAQAGGVNPLWISSPAFAVAILATIITLYLNDSVLTESTQDIKNTVLADKTNFLRRQLQRPGSFVFHNAAICRLQQEGNQTGIDITFFDRGKSDKKGGDTPRWDPEYPHQRLRIIARDHEIGLYEEEATKHLFLKAKLKNFQQFDLVGGSLQPLSAGKANKVWSAGTGDDETGIDPNRITYWGFRKLIDERNERLDTKNAFNNELNELKNIQPPTSESARRIALLEESKEGLDKSINKQTAELHFKLAMSFSCLGFALIGVPLGLRSRSQRSTIGFAYGLLVAVLFFATIKPIQVWARIGMVPHVTIWLPIIILYGVGAYLWYNSRRAAG